MAKVSEVVAILKKQSDLIGKLRSENADLLAALRGMVGDILEGPGALPSTVPEWHQWEPIIQARAAIEKAS